MIDQPHGNGSDGVDLAIDAVEGWRADRLAELRRWVLAADPNITESIKWRKPTNPLGVPTWELNGIICTGEVYKDKVKLTFATGAALDDPAGLFNSSLGGKTRRAIDIREGDQVDRNAFTDLVREAVRHNTD